MKPIILYVRECWRNALKNDTFANTVEKLYAYECWGNALKNDTFACKIGKLYLRIIKEILGVIKKVNNIKVLAHIGQCRLSINIETQVFTKISFH